MPTDDQQILVTGTASAPATFKIPGNGQITPRAVFASFDGSGAGGSFVPALKVISDGGATVGVYPCDTTLAAGASADVSWFPHLAAAAASSPSLASQIVRVFGITLPGDVPNVPAGGSAFVAFTTALTSDATKAAWTNSGTGPNDTITFTAPAAGWVHLMASCQWTAGTKVDCRITPAGGFALNHDGWDSFSNYDATAATNGPNLMDMTFMDFNLASPATATVLVRLTNKDAGASAPEQVQIAAMYYPGLNL